MRLRCLVPLVGAFVFLSAQAQQSAPPEGIPAGPWILTPSLVVGYDYDTNVFQQDADNDPLADYSLVVEPGLGATLPFRNSFFDLHYKATWNDYGQAFTDSQRSQESGTDLNLLFSNLNRLVASANWTSGVAKVETFDPGGEVLYQGNSFHLSNYSLEFSREVRGHRGYALRARRDVFHFDDPQVTNFFDYEGNTADFEYREPFGPRSWATIAYTGSRFDHFCKGLDPFGEPCPGLATPFRTEDSDAISLGVRGMLARDQLYFLRVGKSIYKYRPESFRDFQGLTYEGTFGLPVGGGSGLRVGLLRRPYASFYFNNEYYVVDRVDLDFDHRFGSEVSFGARTAYWRSDYPNRIEAPGDVADGKQRLDRQLREELYANFLLVRRFGIALSVAYQNRSSNIPGLDFKGTVSFVGVTYGFP